jgi:dTDP-4-dehydrorhamnose reductase
VRVDAAEENEQAHLATNFTGSVDLAEACRRRGVHYAGFSSDLVFDGLSDRAYVESDATAPLNIYGISKAMTDDVLLAAPGRTLVVRTTLDLIVDDETGLWHLANGGALSWADFAIGIGTALDLPTDLVDVRPAASMGWTARRPRHAPMSSERGLIMPSLTSAVERFAAELGR